MNVTKYKPLWRQVLLEVIKEEKTETGIYLPEDPSSFKKYKVIKAGPECMVVKEDDIVVLEERSFQTIFRFSDHIPRIQVMEQNIIGIIDND